MRINLTTNEILYTEEQALRAYALATAAENDGYATNLPADDLETPAKLTARFPTYVAPLLGAHKRLGVLAGPDAEGAYTHAVVDWTPEEISDEQESQVQLIADSARDYVERELNAAGMMLVDRMLRANPAQAKALAVEQWVNAVYMEAEQRKALTWAGMHEARFEDFSSFGKKPYTVAQLMAEA